MDCKTRLLGPEVDATLGVPSTDLREQTGEKRPVEGFRTLKRAGPLGREGRVAALLTLGPGDAFWPIVDFWPIVSLLTIGLREANLADHVLELTVHFPPLAHADEREKVLPADPSQVRTPLLLGLPNERPEPEEAHEVGAIVPEPPVKVVGLLLRLARTLARVLNVEAAAAITAHRGGSRARRLRGSSARCRRVDREARDGAPAG